jgi:hypothetical protein
MAISFDLAKLTSRKVRADIGIRAVKSLEKLGSPDDGNAPGGIIGYFFDAAAKLTNFIVSVVGKFFKFSWNLLWSVIVATKNFVWNFNWNATDAELDSSIKSKWAAIKAQLGGTLGNAFGYLACGVLPGALIFVFNQPLGAYILANVLEEALDEFFENMGALIKQTLILGVQIAITETFKSVRKLIKANASLVGRFLSKSPKYQQNFEKMVQAWGAQGSKPWSFALNHEEYIESLDPGDQDAYEEFYEEADEACVEAGYIVAAGLDADIAKEMLARKQMPLLGKERFVEITPNRDVEEEKIVLGGSEELLKPVIIQTLATYQQLGDRDVGVFYGTDNQQPVRSIKPEIVLKFYEEKKDRLITNLAGDTVTRGNPIQMQISFRLMNKDESHFASDATYAKELANKIMAKFGTPPFKIKKGKKLYTYHDWAKGYSMMLWVSDQAEARKVVEQVLDVQGHKVDDDLLRDGSKPVNGLKTKNKKMVLGKIEEVPVTGNKEGLVTFRTAHLNIGNGTKPIWLCDLTGKKRDVIYDLTKV